MRKAKEEADPCGMTTKKAKAKAKAEARASPLRASVEGRVRGWRGTGALCARRRFLAALGITAGKAKTKAKAKEEADSQGE